MYNEELIREAVDIATGDDGRTIKGERRWIEKNFMNG